MKSEDQNQKVWFITGASKGFGLKLTQQLLAQGHFVAATSRSKNDLIKIVGAHCEKFLPLEMDLNNEENVGEAVAETVKKFGRIDNIVNNAGYGLFGAVEEISDAESRQNFDVNVFGTLNVIRRAMPYLRAQKSGHIFNISSIGGYSGDFPGVGIYCATKFAVIGLTEALAIEAKPFGINVTAVLPGYFRTSFLSRDSMLIPKKPIADYTLAHESIARHQDTINQNQPGDPEKGVAAIIAMASEAEPAQHLFLGSDAFAMAKAKMETMNLELDRWEAVTTGTDF